MLMTAENHHSVEPTFARPRAGDHRTRLDESHGMVSVGRSTTFPFAQWVASDVWRTVYFDEGEGRPLVLVHGLGGNITHWEYVVEKLARQHRVIGLDLAGFGATQRPNLSYTIELLSDHLIAFIEDRGLQRVTLVGHSLGGAVCIAAALKRPDLFDGLAMIGAAGLAPLPLWMRWGSHLVLHRGLMLPVLPLMANWILDNVFVESTKENPYVRHFRQSSLRLGGFTHLLDFVRVSASVCKDVVHTNYSDRLHELKLPVLAIWGGADRLVALPGVAAALGNIANLTCEVLPRTGHMPMIERPREVLALLEKFLARNA